MFPVDLADLNLWSISQKPWKSSILWTNKRNGRVIPFATIFRWQQSVVALMKMRGTSGQKLRYMLLTNWISILRRCISWTTSVTLSASLATASLQALNSRQKQWWILDMHIDYWIIVRLPSRFCAGKPKWSHFGMEHRMQMVPNTIVIIKCL